MIFGPRAALEFPTRNFKLLDIASTRGRYLDLLAGCLLGALGETPYTMLSAERLINVRQVLEEVADRNIPGDFIETGVWRGGACIYARACIGSIWTWTHERRVVVADSFAGLPPPDPKYPHDARDRHHEDKTLAVSIEEVRANFQRFNWLDSQVVFLRGWFDQSLPLLDANQKFSVIRLDGDMYQSTMDALTNLYDKLSPGGFCIIDDFGAVSACQHAIADFREQRGITEQIYNIDGTGIFWVKS